MSGENAPLRPRVLQACARAPLTSLEGMNDGSIMNAWNSIFYGSLAGIASMLGITLVIARKEWTITHSHLVNSLAAGTILGVAFLSLLPESLEMNSHALPLAFVGFLVLYVIESAIVFHSGAEMRFHGHKEHGPAARAWTVFTGLFLHSLIDGLVIGIGFEISHEVGILAAAGVILHELPEGATTFALLVKWVSGRVALVLSILVGVATPFGALFALIAFPHMSRETMGGLLAAAGGSFLYIGAADLVPETHTQKGWVNAICLIGGAFLAFLLTRIVH